MDRWWCICFILLGNLPKSSPQRAAGTCMTSQQCRKRNTNVLVNTIRSTRAVCRTMSRHCSKFHNWHCQIISCCRSSNLKYSACVDIKPKARNYWIQSGAVHILQLSATPKRLAAWVISCSFFCSNIWSRNMADSKKKMETWFDQGAWTKDKCSTCAYACWVSNLMWYPVTNKTTNILPEDG